MGHRFTVLVWRKDIGDDQFRYHMVHEGESFAVALWKLISAKRTGAGCVKMEWR